MSILIISDTHGLVHEVQEVVKRHQAEAIFHCGDFCVDRTRPPFSAMTMVRGNCDVERSVPEEQVSQWRDLLLFQTHGHLYGVKQSLLKLHYRAEQLGANVVLFGHSHFPVCTVERGILFINPGSLQLPRGFDRPTYACLKQLSATADQVEVEVTYYDHRGEVNDQRGGRFTIRKPALGQENG